MMGGTATFSFENREKLEGPDIPSSLDVPAGHCKTYQFTNRVSSLFHGTNQCSNTAHWIKTENYWMQDNAYSTQTAGENWSTGTLIWKIPVGWHRKNMAGNGLQGVERPDYEKYDDRPPYVSRPLLIGGRRDLYKQTREILEDGTFRSEKYGHWITRGTLCRIILDGSTVQWYKFH